MFSSIIKCIIRVHLVACITVGTRPMVIPAGRIPHRATRHIPDTLDLHSPLKHQHHQPAHLRPAHRQQRRLLVNPQLRHRHQLNLRNKLTIKW